MRLLESKKSEASIKAAGYAGYVGVNALPATANTVDY